MHESEKHFKIRALTPSHYNVQNGEEITILSRGAPVARIISVNSGALPKNEMKKILLSRLKAQDVIGLLKWHSVSRILLSFWRH
jgi:hypothetical protein